MSRLPSNDLPCTDLELVAIHESEKEPISAEGSFEVVQDESLLALVAVEPDFGLGVTRRLADVVVVTSSQKVDCRVGLAATGRTVEDDDFDSLKLSVRLSLAEGEPQKLMCLANLDALAGLTDSTISKLVFLALTSSAIASGRFSNLDRPSRDLAPRDQRLSSLPSCSSPWLVDECLPRPQCASLLIFLQAARSSCS